MAPLRSKRPTARSKHTRAAKSPRDAISHPTSTHVPAIKPRADGFVDYSTGPAWRTSKKDKRAMKHNVLMNKVLDGGVSKKVRRRRPGKKMEAVEGLGKSLAEALPDLDGDEDEWEGVDEDDEEGVGGGEKVRRRKGQEGKMVMKSLKHRPGAMKRKRVMEERERERFGRNLAQLVGGSGNEEGGGGAEKTGGGGGNAAGGPSQADRWAALRQFIGGSMEKDSAFAKG